MNNSDRLVPRIVLSRRARPRRAIGDGEDRDSIRRWRRYAWVALGVSFAAYLLGSLAYHQALYPAGRLNFFDLRVYRGAGQLVLNGRSVYGGPIWNSAPFTYPPFAAVVFTPLALLPLTVDEVLVTIFGVVAVFAVCALALRLPMADREEAARTRHWRWVVIPVAAAAALWLEPVTATLGYGQINLLIALLIVADLSRRDAAKSKGALIGLAAGLKLTPLIFVPYLLFSRRRRPAIVALGTFASTIAVGYAALPGDTQRFWGDGLFVDSRRVGGSYVPANQSLRGLILRLDPSFGSGRLLAIALIVGIIGVTLAVLASRRGDEAMGFSLCATTGLLVSPVSWTHHWTLAVPALLLIGMRAFRARSRLGMTAAAAVLLVGYSYLPKLTAEQAAGAAAELRLARHLTRHERSPMNRSLRLVPLSALAAIALAACGSSHSQTVLSLGGGTHTQQSASSDNLAAWRAAVGCVRRHGMPGVPDPVVSADGQVTVPGYASSADLTPAARSACAAELEAESSTGSTHPVESASDIQALVRYAACMRTHGLPRWPDPNERGEFHVKSADAGTLAQNNRASAACNTLLPPSGAHFIVTPSGL